MQNESETEFHRVYEVSPTQQLTKLTHLLMESGDGVVCSSCIWADSQSLSVYR